MTPTLETVEHLADQLSEQDQKTLLQRLGVKLHVFPPEAQEQSVDGSEYHAKRIQLARQLLAEVEGIEDDSQGTSDSVEVLRCLREGRQV